VILQTPVNLDPLQYTKWVTLEYFLRFSIKIELKQSKKELRELKIGQRERRNLEQTRRRGIACSVALARRMDLVKRITNNKKMNGIDHLIALYTA